MAVTLTIFQAEGQAQGRILAICQALHTQARRRHGKRAHCFIYPHNITPIQLEKLKLVKTDIGRGRAWIRLALNENALESYIRMFTEDPAADRREFYDLFVPQCRCTECVSSIVSSGTPLSSIPTCAACIRCLHLTLTT